MKALQGASYSASWKIATQLKTETCPTCPTCFFEGDPSSCPRLNLLYSTNSSSLTSHYIFFRVLPDKSFGHQGHGSSVKGAAQINTFECTGMMVELLQSKLRRSCFLRNPRFPSRNNQSFKKLVWANIYESSICMSHGMDEGECYSWG